MRILGIFRRSPRVVPTGHTRVVSLVLALLIAAGALAKLGVAWATALPENAVLRAGDEIVTTGEFERRVHVLRALYGVSPPESGPKLDQFNKDAAKSIAVSMTLDRAARDHNIVIADKTAQDTLTKMVEQQLEGRGKFDQFLATQRISEGDVLTELKRQLATSKLFEQVTAGVKPVTADEVRSAYQSRQKELVTPERRQLRNIVVDSEQTAAEVLQQAQAGADFASLAVQYSLDESTKTKGGDLGMLAAADLDPEFAKTAFSAGDKSVFGPAKTQYGWNVGQVLAIQPAQQLPFEQVKQQLEEQLNNERKLDTWRKWNSDQIKSAEIEYADRYRPDNPDSPPANTPR